MYAVITSGGKQYRVQQGDKLRLELLNGTQAGDAVKFDKVLMLANQGDVKIGVPFVAGAAVSAEVVAHGRAGKISIIKLKRRKHHMKRMGHRQWFTLVEIKEIAG